MTKEKRKILVLVEGARTDVALLERLLSTYQVDIKYEIVPYCTNIYTLYHEMFEDNDPYSDILLIFDLDPHDSGFTPEKIIGMANYFVESSDMGKLYINYPMVEAFYHMASIPDPNFDSYYATLDELTSGEYKARVNRENRDHDYRKFATRKEECDTVIMQNINKAWRLIGNNRGNNLIPAKIEILNAQLNHIQSANKVAVLSTCTFFIPEYNPNLIH